MHDVIVIGGGIAGLVNAILLSRDGINVLLFEKGAYPFHRVCGEYISNEVKPFLQKHGLFPSAFGPTSITKFNLTAVNGKKAHIPLGLGGFGISRFAFDQFLFEQAVAAGVTVIQNTSVTEVKAETKHFQVKANRKIYESKLVIGAFGKRSVLDRSREFMQRKSPYLGVKYHIRTDLPEHEISLHNFEKGYCGVSRVEDGKYNLCYLSHRDNLKQYGTINAMEQHVLRTNPYLKQLWNNSDFLFSTPKVINEISFEPKELIHNHILMCGDTAGMITPLCGNGMAMAIRSAKILSNLILSCWNSGSPDRAKLEELYARQWHRSFGRRLFIGRSIQRLFGARWKSNLAVGLVKFSPVGSAIVRLTHGSTFE